MVKLMVWGLAYNTDDIKTCFTLPVKLLHIKSAALPKSFRFLVVTNASAATQKFEIRQLTSIIESIPFLDAIISISVFDDRSYDV